MKSVPARFLPMNTALVFGAFAIYRVMAIRETPWLHISLSSAGEFLILGLGYLGRRAFGRPSPPKPEGIVRQ